MNKRFEPFEIFKLDPNSGYLTGDTEVYRPLQNYYEKLASSDYSFEQIYKIDRDEDFTRKDTEILYEAIQNELKKRNNEEFKQDFLVLIK